MTNTLRQSYEICRQITRRRARNFYYPFLMFPSDQRSALYAVYSFMRYCDDISDGDTDLSTKQLRLENWRTVLDRSRVSEAADHPILPAFHHTLDRFAIPKRFFHEIIDGVTLDLSQNRYETFSDLYRYCYHVASAVGLVCIHIFGFHSSDAYARAEACGIAFQLTNILRDLKEDGERNRIYLPQEDLRRFEYLEEDLLNGVYNDRFQALMAFQTARSRRYYAEGKPLLTLVDRRSRAGLASLMAVYQALLQEIEDRRFNVFAGRLSVPFLRKIALVMGAAFGRR